MTIPKVRTVKVGEDRYYSDSVTRDQVPGVTSILGVRAKPALIGWAAKSAAEYAVDNIASVSALAQTDKFAAIDLVKKAHTRASGKAAGAGTAVHGIVERLLNGERNVSVSAEERPFIVQFQKFANEYQLEVAYNEVTIWSDRYRYAGTIDGLWKLTGPGIKQPGMLAVCDIKTGASGIWADAALQLSAYKNADHLLLPDGTRKPMPETSDQSWAIWLRPEGYALIPLDTGNETFSQFLRLRRTFEWNANNESKVVGSPVNKEPLTRGKK